MNNNNNNNNNESFVSKTLNEGHMELGKFPASTVRQLAK